MCCCNPWFCIFAAGFSIVESIIYLAWYSWGTGLYLCYELPKKQTMGFLIYLTYFYADNCVTPRLEDLPTDSDASLAILVNASDLQFPPKSPYADITNNLLFTFIIIHSLWIIAAVLLLIGVCSPVKHWFSLVFMLPWLLILLVILIFDVVATVLYAIDIPKTWGFANWFHFIGGRDQPAVNIINDTTYIQIATQIPSILMTAIFSRFIIVWIINLFLLFPVIRATVNSFEACEDTDSSKPKKAKNILSTIITNEEISKNFQICKTRSNSILSIRKEAEEKRFKFQYDTDDDEVAEKSEERHRRKSKQKQAKLQNDRNEMNLIVTIDQPNCHHLTIHGGYEGDRSNSPSPLPFRKENISFKFNSTDTEPLSKEISPRNPP